MASRTLSPAEADAATLGACVRHHGDIQTRLHYIRDRTDDEGRSQVRTHNGPRAMATFRNTAISRWQTRGLPNIQGALNHLARHPDQVAHLLLG